jgi:hypothetical protein
MANEPYEPPVVEELNTEHGPVATAPGHQQITPIDS